MCDCVCSRGTVRCIHMCTYSVMIMCTFPYLAPRLCRSGRWRFGFLPSHSFFCPLRSVHTYLTPSDHLFALKRKHATRPDFQLYHLLDACLMANNAHFRGYQVLLLSAGGENHAGCGGGEGGEERMETSTSLRSQALFKHTHAATHNHRSCFATSLHSVWTVCMYVCPVHFFMYTCIFTYAFVFV